MGQHHIQALVVVVYVFISNNWVYSTEPFPPDCKSPPQQGRAEFHGQQRQMLQRDIAGNLSSMYQMQKCDKSSFIECPGLTPARAPVSFQEYCKWQTSLGSGGQSWSHPAMRYSDASQKILPTDQAPWNQPEKEKPRNQCCALYSFSAVNKYCITYTVLTLKDSLHSR